MLGGGLSGSTARLLTGTGNRNSPLARPRKYVTPAEIAAAAAERTRKNSERRKAKRDAAHARKADPTKRSDAFVNAKNWPKAPIDNETLRVVGEIVGEIGTKKSDLTRMCVAARVFDAWEEAHRARLSPILPADLQSAMRTLDADERAAIELWNESFAVLEWCRDVLLPRQKRALRRADKERADAAAQNITVAQLRNRRDAMAKAKWSRRQASDRLHDAGTSLLAKRAQRAAEEAERMQSLSDFGRF